MGTVSWQRDLEAEADKLSCKIGSYPRLLRFCLDDIPFHDDSFCSGLERMIGAIRDAVCFMRAACEAPSDARAVLKLATLRTRDARVVYSYYVDSWFANELLEIVKEIECALAHAECVI